MVCIFVTEVSGLLLSSVHMPVEYCRFHSCQEAAMQALYALKARAEYELLTVSMQVSIASYMMKRLRNILEKREKPAATWD